MAAPTGSIIHYLQKSNLSNHKWSLITLKKRTIKSPCHKAGGFVLAVYFAFLVTTDLMTNRVAIISTMAMGRTIIQLRMKPARM